MNEAQLTMRGHVASDPVVLETSRNEPMIRFRFAHTPWHRTARDEGWQDGPTSFYDVVAFRGLAQHAAASLSKGDPVIVTGQLRVTPWERDGRTGLNVTVQADDIGHSMHRGVSRFERAGAGELRRPAAPSTSAQAARDGVDPADADTDEYVVRSA